MHFVVEHPGSHEPCDKGQAGYAGYFVGFHYFFSLTLFSLLPFIPTLPYLTLGTVSKAGASRFAILQAVSIAASVAMKPIATYPISSIISITKVYWSKWRLMMLIVVA